VVQRELRSLEKTLAGLAGLAAPADLGATMGRDQFSATLVSIPPSGETRMPLPTVSIDLDHQDTPAESFSSDTDLVVVGKLGEGGMGIVHLVQQRSLDRMVAVKTTRTEVDAQADAALCAEAKVTGSLEHPNIVPVHAFGRTADGRAAMVMKRIEGVPWLTLMQQPDHGAWEAIATGDRIVDHLQILAQVANALSFAHRHSIVHRDVKPENVMVGSYGEVWVVDFGLAVRCDEPWPPEPSIVGTPVYMAPEMVVGEPVDERTDVYLLGATLHEILTGQPPHDGSSLPQVLANAYASEPPSFDGSVPHELAAICRRAMARSPEDRFPTARAFRGAVSDYLVHRASYRLAERGAERLAAARAAEDLAARRASLTEARFACLQAMDQWPGNELARATAREAAVESVEIEIEARNAAGARAILDSLADPPEEIRTRLAALEAEMDAERRDAARLAELERDRDIRLGADSRKWVMIVFALVALVMGTYAVRASGESGLLPSDLLRLGGLMLAVVSGIVAVTWRRLAVNAVGRQFAIGGVGLSVAIVLHRTVAYFGGDSIPSILSTDMLLTGLVTAAGGVTIDSRMFYGVPVMIGGAFTAVFFPGTAPAAFSVSTTVLILLAAWFFQRMQRERD
jgi:eukaryotic-like serine/threonine-protein kinase